MPKREQANGLSVAAVICGALWLGPVAIVLGALGLRGTTAARGSSATASEQKVRSTRSWNTTLAVIGLALGIIGSGGWVAFGLNYFEPSSQGVATASAVASPEDSARLAGLGPSELANRSPSSNVAEATPETLISESDPTSVPLPGVGKALLYSLPLEIDKYTSRGFASGLEPGALESYRGVYDLTARVRAEEKFLLETHAAPNTLEDAAVDDGAGMAASDGANTNAWSLPAAVSSDVAPPWVNALGGSGSTGLSFGWGDSPAAEVEIFADGTALFENGATLAPGGRTLVHEDGSWLAYAPGPDMGFEVEYGSGTGQAGADEVPEGASRRGRVVVTATRWASSAEAESQRDSDISRMRAFANGAKATSLVGHDDYDDAPGRTGAVIDLGAGDLKAIVWSDFTTSVTLIGPSPDISDMFTTFTLGPAPMPDAMASDLD